MVGQVLGAARRAAARRNAQPRWAAQASRRTEWEQEADYGRSQLSNRGNGQAALGPQPAESTGPLTAAQQCAVRRAAPAAVQRPRAAGRVLAAVACPRCLRDWSARATCSARRWKTATAGWSYGCLSRRRKPRKPVGVTSAGAASKAALPERKDAALKAALPGSAAGWRRSGGAGAAIRNKKPARLRGRLLMPACAGPPSILRTATEVPAHSAAAGTLPCPAALRSNQPLPTPPASARPSFSCNVASTLDHDLAVRQMLDLHLHVRQAGAAAAP